MGPLFFSFCKFTDPKFRKNHCNNLCLHRANYSLWYEFNMSMRKILNFYLMISSDKESITALAKLFQLTGIIYPQLKMCTIFLP